MDDIIESNRRYGILRVIQVFKPSVAEFVSSKRSFNLRFGHGYSRGYSCWISSEI